MAFVTIGDVTVAAKAAALADPVGHSPPATEAEIYAAFVETITKSGLAGVIFDAMPTVVNKDVPASSFYPWPDGYATITPPWGRPDDTGPGGSGYREVQLIDDLGASPQVKSWTNSINNTAKGRAAALQGLGDDAKVMATAIDAALVYAFKQGATVMTNGITPLIECGPLGFTITTKTWIGFTPIATQSNQGFISCVKDIGNNRFRFISSSGTHGGNIEWFAAVRND